MKIVKPSVTLLWITPDAEKKIEAAGRTAYKSEKHKNAETQKHTETFIRKIIELGHESVLEHACASVRIICDRGVSHEMVRHRLVSYTQESTRYCDYAGEGIEVITPISPVLPGGSLGGPFNGWDCLCKAAERQYKDLREHGISPQLARSVLPTCLKTELVMTTNFREWRHVLRLRTSKKAHPQMGEIANMIWSLLREQSPACFPILDFPDVVCPGFEIDSGTGDFTGCEGGADCPICEGKGHTPGTIICPDCELSVPVGSPCPHCTRQHFEPDGERAEDNQKDFDAECDAAGL